MFRVFFSIPVFVLSRATNPMTWPSFRVSMVCFQDPGWNFKKSINNGPAKKKKAPFCSFGQYARATLKKTVGSIRVPVLPS
jgi:hypothetical protein